MVRLGASRRELELVLIVRSKDFEEVLEKLVTLSSIGGYRLGVASSRRIHDRYFDTPEGLLGRKKMNLRIREADGRFWLTWKRGPGRLGFWKRNERRELELPWSEKSVAVVVGELAKRGIRLHHTREGDLSDPVETMKSLGLVLLQDRETYRRFRDIMSVDGETVLAEFAIDSVDYDFDGRKVRLDEVEVEARDSGGGRVLEAVKKGLLNLFGDDLEAWSWGKLVTGRMIERMLRRGELGGMFDGSRLSPEAFGRLRAALSAHGPGD